MIKYIDVSPYDINGNPTTVEVRPGVTKGINKAKGLFRGKPKWGVGAGAPASFMPPMPNIM